MERNLVLPCLRGLLGEWIYYSTLMTAEQISTWVKPVKDIRESHSLDEYLQRELQKRSELIAKYLLTDERRFFNSIIIGVFGGIPDWFEFDLSKAESILAKEDKEAFKSSIGIMTLSGNIQMFAIDGQHRVAGITIANEKDSDHVMINDQFSVILVAHIDDHLGMKRTRKLFSDINNSQPVSGGDKIKIDEQDVAAIVTRRIYATSKYFDNGVLISLTDNARLEANDTKHFTNLLGLYGANKIIKKALFKKIPETKEWDEANVINLYKITGDFYDYIFSKIDSYREYFTDKTLTIKQARVNNSYLLFRPLGLSLLARIYVHFMNKKDGLKILEKKINKISFVFPESPFNKILWNNGKMGAKNQKLALEMALYLLGEYQGEETSLLLDKYRIIVKNSKAKLPRKITK